MKRRILFPLVLLLLSLQPGWAQEVSGRLQGRILDSESRALPDVNVSVTSAGLQGTRGASTNERGVFYVPLLPPGIYKVRLSHIAHHPVVIENVPVQLGKTTSLTEIVLELRTIEMEEVVITVENPVLDPTSAAIGANLDVRTLEPLPVDRNYRSIAAMIPQANASFLGDEVNVTGSTGHENVYFIDGINVTDSFTARSGTNLPYNFIREIEIRTGGYEAEFASALGGILNATTRSGSNTFHGQLFGFFTGDALSQKERVAGAAESVEGMQQYDAGFGLGGPLVNDKLWFYAAYNPNVVAQDVELSGFGKFRDRKTSHLFAGKLTWRVVDNANIVFTAIGDPTTHHEVFTDVASIANPETALWKTETGGVNLSLQADYYPKQNLLLRGVVSHVRSRDNFGGDTELGRTEPRFVDFETGIESGGVGGSEKVEVARTEMQLSTTVFMGNHALKAGLSFEDNFVKINNQLRNGGLGTVVRVDDSTFSAFPNTQIGRVHNRIPSVFVQDSWPITPGLRLNFGLRWDAQFMIGDDGKVAQRITDQWQPRAGFIFQPGQTKSQKLFGSFGRFYERIPTKLSSIYHLQNEFYIIDYDHNPLIDPSGGDTLDISNSILEEIDGLKGQFIDEFVLGYEMALFERYKVGVRGIYRNLGEVVEDALDVDQGIFVIGNPGKGNMDFIPGLKRKYTGLEFTIEKSGGRTFNFFTSYVLSRARGNYTGLFDSDTGALLNPNIIPGNDLAESLVNADGLLPNDRTHVFKSFGSYRTDFGLDIGSFFTWQSGTPLNDFGASSFSAFYLVFLQKRGTTGRTPSIWDLNLRLSYDLGRLFKSSVRPRLIVDALHIASRRKAVNFDQKHFFATDEEGNQILENENYLEPTLFQPPMTIRLGMEVNF